MDYYAIAGEASRKIAGHPGLVQLQQLVKNAVRVMDVGCGEGSRLETLSGGKPGWGIDVNPTAIRQAKNRYPHHHFQVGTGNLLPFPNGSFDLVYSTFTLEHTLNPELVISEMIRICTPGGYVVWLCPNFGSPNRRSPVSTAAPVKKLVQGFAKDIFSVLGATRTLRWTKVKPRRVYRMIDDDTTVEPYVRTLLRFLKTQPVRVVHSSSLWSLESSPKSFHHHVFSLLGRTGIFPFKYWGPQLYVVCVKSTDVI